MTKNKETIGANSIIGILGGMGPEATVYQYQLIVKYTPVSKDQDHIPTIIYSNPLIPDRTESILTNSHEKIIKELIKTAKVLESAGASFIIIPCNTAHYYLEHVQKAISIPIIDMIQITAEKVNQDLDNSDKKKRENRIGLLATNGVIKTRIYHEKFKTHEMQILTPNDEDQEKLMNIIHDIKINGIKNSLKKDCIRIINNLQDKYPLSHVILGCTELPLLFQGQNKINQTLLINPMEILAKHLIIKIKGKIKES
ncbi:MAG: aspartate/glutamate racemase family protein [Promethearchaeota archaeon]